MSIIVCGINHKTAPLALREKVVFSQEKLPLYLSDLLNQENLNEAVILSTCNRSEIYCVTDDVDKIVEWFCRQHQLPREQLEPVMVVYKEQQAVEHIMQVACGLDSMVLGESQILGQMKNTFSESCAAGTVGTIFNRLFQQVFAVAKEVRTNTAIGACPVSVASAAVGLAKQLFPALPNASVLVVGAGDTIDLVLRHLKAQSIVKLFIANRGVENAAALANHYQGEALTFDELPAALAKVDLVISATGSPLPIITQEMMRAVLKERHERSLVIIDLAVPRDVEASVAELFSVKLYCIDDLKAIIQHNLRGREHAAEKACEEIQQKSHEFMGWMQSLDKVAIAIRAYRTHIEEMCQAELAKAVRQLQRGDDPAEVLSGFAYTYTNKLLHTPSVQLRQAGSEGRWDVLQLAQELFAIPQSESELL